jgi:hypothetical protein
MILTQAKTVDPRNLANFAWSGLRRFQNVDYVSGQIMQMHGLGKEHREDAKKQATQIRFCLIQAREYYDAALGSSLATKPALLYYAAMHLALTEILFKQTGDSSLDRAREQHAHHGLELRVAGSSRKRQEFSAQAEVLRAAPLIKQGDKRFGTFELWHRSAREMPITGKVIRRYQGGTSTAYEVLLRPADERLPLLPAQGISLLECLRTLPGTAQFIAQHGIAPNVVRGKVELDQDPVTPSRSRLTVVVHPGDDRLIETFLSNIKIHPNDVDRVEYIPLASGGIIQIINNEVSGPVQFSIPHGSMWDGEEARFSAQIEPLNEFGFLYVALYIAGNYARYFPDHWMVDVERNSPIALAIEELIEVAQNRIPLLTLSELTRVYHVSSA